MWGSFFTCLEVYMWIAGWSIKLNKKSFLNEEISGRSFFTLLMVFKWMVGAANQSNKKSFRHEEIEMIFFTLLVVYRWMLGWSTKCKQKIVSLRRDIRMFVFYAFVVYFLYMRMVGVPHQSLKKKRFVTKTYLWSIRMIVFHAFACTGRWWCGTRK